MLTFDVATHVYSDPETGVIYPSVTQVIKEAGLLGWTVQDDADWYMDRGSAVHEATALWDRGILDESTLDPQIRPYLDAWIKFRKESGYSPKIIEKPLLHVTYRYAGTIDRDCIEIKTGQYAPWHSLQIAAYAHLIDMQHKHWTSVYLHEDGRYMTKTHTPIDIHNAFKIFTAALS